MSEYSHIEKPFLTQLKNLGWETVEQGFGIPTDPTKSKRTTFREVTLRDLFIQSVRDINTTETGEKWLTQHQLAELHDDIIKLTRKNLLEANKEILKLLLDNAKADKNGAIFTPPFLLALVLRFFLFLPPPTTSSFVLNNSLVILSITALAVSLPPNFLRLMCIYYNKINFYCLI